MQIAGSILTFLISVLGAGVVFALGFQQFTDSLSQLFDKRIRHLLQGVGKKPAQGFVGGFFAAILSGGRTASTMTLWALVNGGRVTRTRGAWLLAGMYPGSLVILGFLIFLGYSGFSAILGFLFLTFGLVSILNTKGAFQIPPGIVTGLGLGLLGISVLNGYLQLLPYSYAVAQGMQGVFQSFWSPLLFFIIGVLLTLAYRSSSTVWVVAFSLAFRGWIPPGLAWAMMLGSHGGFTLLGVWVCRVFSQKAQRLSMVHMLQAFGALSGTAVLWWVMNPGYPGPYQLPWFLYGMTVILFIFHGLSAALFSGLYKILSEKVFPGRIVPGSEAGSLRLVPDYVPESLNANLSLLRNGLARMAFLDHEMLMVILNTSQELTESPDEDARIIRDRRQEVKSLADTIDQSITRLVQQPCSPTQADTLARQKAAVVQLDRISESCDKIMLLLEKSYAKKYRFHKEGQDELFDFTALVLDFLKYNSDFLSGKLHDPDWNLAKTMEDDIDTARNRLKKRTRKYMEKSPNAQIKGELAFIDVIGHLEHIGDSCLAISRAVFASRY